MPRRFRITLTGVPLHLIQRGNNRQACFFADEDYRLYLDWLKKYARKSACAIHVYVLMTNHVHLLLTPARDRFAPDQLYRGDREYGAICRDGRQKAQSRVVSRLGDFSAADYHQLRNQQTGSGGGGVQKWLWRLLLPRGLRRNVSAALQQQWGAGAKKLTFAMGDAIR